MNRISLGDSIGRELVPNLDLVAVGVTEEHVRLARHELSAMLDRATGFLDGVSSLVYITGVGQTEPEMLDASRLSNVVGAFLEDEDVARPRSLCLQKVRLPVDG